MIALEFDEHVATVILDRPPVNAFNDELLDDFIKIMARLEREQGIAVLHIRSTQKVFCAGADLDVMRDLLTSAEGRDRMIDLIRKLQQALFRLENLNSVTIAEIGGAALGGGLELALACDLRVAADNARLGLPEVTLGLLPGAGGTQRLPRLCGEGVARRLILGGEVIDGKEAVRLGIVQWAIEPEKLPSWTGELVQRISSLPADALASCKRCIAASFNESVDGYEYELQETRKLHDSKQTQDRIRAFVEKPGDSS